VTRTIYAVFLPKRVQYSLGSPFERKTDSHDVRDVGALYAMYIMTFLDGGPISCSCIFNSCTYEDSEVSRIASCRVGGREFCFKMRPFSTAASISRAIEH
jgi:hypothetical protein